MYLQLMRRRRSTQRAVKNVWVPCRYEHVVLPGGRIDENLLLHMIPAGWLPAKPEEILLAAATSSGSTGIKNLSVFRPWGRHFDCWILELWVEEPYR